MAQENIIQLIGDSYDNEKLKFLFNKLGKKAFKGQSSNSGDMTISGYITYLLIQALVKDKNTTTGAWTKIVKDNFLDEKNSMGQNILSQTLLALNNNSKVDITAIMNFLKENAGAEWINDKLKEPDSNNVTSAHIICNNPDYSEKFEFESYAKSFVDSNFKGSFFRPIAMLILNNQKDALSKIIANAGEKEKILNPFPKQMSDIPDNSLLNAIASLTLDELAEQITNKDTALNQVINSGIFVKSNLGVNTINSTIDSSKITGVKPEEISFDYNSYADLVANDEGEVHHINPAFYIIDRLKAKLTKDIVNELNNFFPMYIAPVVGNNKKSEGFAPIMIITNLLTAKDNQWSNGNLVSILKSYTQQAIAIANGVDGSDFKKFLMLNALLGTVQQFSNNANVNLYGVMNLIFNKINTAHKSWCDANNKKFDDYKDNYDKLISDILPGANFVSFDNAYKYWCQTYDKEF